MPIDNNRFMIDKGEVEDEEELRELNKRLIEVAKSLAKYQLPQEMFIL